VLIAAGLAGAGAWAGAALQHSGVSLGTLLLAGLNTAPPALFLLGLGAVVFGARPRRTSVVIYAYLAWSFLVEFFGAIVRTNHWVMDTSVVFRMVPAPATSPGLGQRGRDHRPRRGRRAGRRGAAAPP
jgi:ABC-2 type transport system permease protein